MRLGILLLALVCAVSAHAQPYYSVSGGGAQFQNGGGLPMPIQAATTMNPPTGMGLGVGTLTMFPPLLIPVNPDPAKALVKQTAGPDPKQLTIPPGVLRRPVQGPAQLGVAFNNPKLFQAQTNLEFSAPAPSFGSVELRAGGRTGPPTITFVVSGGGTVRFQKTASQFGGPLRTKVAAASPVRIWADLFPVKAPCKHPVFGGADPGCKGVILERHPGQTAVVGAPVGSYSTHLLQGMYVQGVPNPGFYVMTPGGPASMSNYVVLSIPNANGTIAMSAPNPTMKSAAVTDMATSLGFPWTTGRISITQVEALGAIEVFRLTGMDSRVGGVGAISLVSGSVSVRAMSGGNANRGWMRLTVPEPGAALGAAAALAALALCHGFTRRRTRDPYGVVQAAAGRAQRAEGERSRKN